MKNDQIIKMETALKEINDLLGEKIQDPSVAKTVELIQKRSALIKKIHQEEWSAKSPEEKILFRKNTLHELEKYYTKYGENERDVSNKYKYYQAYLELVDAITLLNSLAIKETDKIVSRALLELLNTSSFVEVTQREINLSIKALMKCLSFEDVAVSVKGKFTQLEELDSRQN